MAEIEKDKRDLRGIFFLSAPLRETIWGSTYFKDRLALTTNPSIGEMWSCSGHPSLPSLIEGGPYDGKPLNEVYREHPELFPGTAQKEFPILVKLIATNDDLSIQVHPDDDYARRVEDSLGKYECWLILESKEGSSLVLGNSAKDKDDLVRKVRAGDYASLISPTYVNEGEFYPVSPGTLHAIGKDIVLLEVQQSSDVTYRFYDYGRVDRKTGKTRELHVEKALDVCKAGPYDEEVKTLEGDKQTLTENAYFSLRALSVEGETTLEASDTFEVVTSLSHDLEVEGRNLGYGRSFILSPNAGKVRVRGKGRIIVTRPNS